MNALSPAIRKAAVLIDSLDEPAADALLDQMPPDVARRVRSAVMELGEVHEPERQAVLTEFLRGQPSPAAAATDSGVELAPSLTQRLEQPPGESSLPAAADAQPLDFLRDISPREIARVLACENAQIIAVVVGRLAADLAAGVLEHLHADLATDVLERLAWLDEPAAEVLAEIANHLREELARSIGPRRHTSPSLAGLHAVLGAMDFATRDRVLTGLGRRNGALARRLGYLPAEHRHQTAAHENYAVSSFRYRLERPQAPAPLIQFDDFAALDDDALLGILAAAGPQVSLLALTGADEALIERITGQLPAREAAALTKRLKGPRSARLADVEAARDQLVAAARCLAEDGAIALPARRFVAAV
jgi:flagellar motor switch protein FliG